MWIEIFSKDEFGIRLVARDHLGHMEAIMAKKLARTLSAKHSECITIIRAL